MEPLPDEEPEMSLYPVHTPESAPEGSKAPLQDLRKGIGMILPNFAHHLTNCPIDQAFEPHLWSDPRK
jgi:hypothetical protein